MNWEGLKEKVEPIDPLGREEEGEGRLGIGGRAKKLEGGGVVVMVGVRERVRRAPGQSI